MVAPAAVWSVFEDRIRTIRSPSATSTSPTVRAASSLRRSAPANPSSSSARSRRPITAAGQNRVSTVANTVRSCSSRKGLARRGGALRVARIPRSTADTPGSAPGAGWPAARWAALIPASHRASVAGAYTNAPVSSTSAAACARYSPTAAGAAGNGTQPSRVHQAANFAQSPAYAARVLAGTPAARNDAASPPSPPGRPSSSPRPIVSPAMACVRPLTACLRRPRDTSPARAGPGSPIPGRRSREGCIARAV